MALFGSKKKEENEKPAAKAGPVKAPAPSGGPSQAEYAHVFASPRITEKASMKESMGAYTFDIAQRANKREIFMAIKNIFKVTPKRIHIVQVPEKLKRNMRTGKRGVKKGGKKAYVYLKKGDTINIR